MQLIEERLALGKKRYGHGVRPSDNTTQWGTKTDSWSEMAQEEFLDGMIYICADYIRTYKIPFDGDDANSKILELIENTIHIRSGWHRTSVNVLKSLIKQKSNPEAI